MAEQGEVHLREDARSALHPPHLVSALYGPDTLDESWKVFEEEQRQESLRYKMERKKREDEAQVRRQELEERMKETRKKNEIEAKRKKEEAREREEKRRKQFDDSKERLTKANTKWKLWK